MKIHFNCLVRLKNFIFANNNFIFRRTKSAEMTKVHLHQNHHLSNEPKATLLLIHGLHEHSGRYNQMGELFSNHGINVYTFDLRGHGKSEGERHFVSSVDEYVNDVEQVLEKIPNDLPIFILGHSMGGLIAVNFLLQSNYSGVSGLILSGAALKPGKDITPFKAMLVKWVARFFPRLKTLPVKPELISRDPAEVEKYMNDPFIPLYGAKAGLGVALLNAMERVKERYNQITMPALIMHGSDDQLTDPEGSKIFYEKVGSKDKTLQIWDGCYHEIFNEINKQEILSFTLDWIEKRI